MKTANRIGILATVFAGVSLLASSSVAIAEAGRIRARQERQQMRIGQGIRSGALTAREAARLEVREAALQRGVRRLRSDGLTHRERFAIERRQDRISRAIDRQKHDCQTRRR